MLALNENEVLVSYRDGANNNYGTSIVLAIDDTSITRGFSNIFNNVSSSYTSSVALNADTLLVSYRDDAANGRGTSTVVNTVDEECIKKSTSKQNIRGIAQETGTSGQTIHIKTI